MKKLCFLCFIVFPFCIVFADKAKIERDICYTKNTDEYSLQRCKLDVKIPSGKIKGIIVWFHGGGISGGSKNIPDGFAENGYMVVAPNYRLSPKIKAHMAIEDAADALAWTFENAENYGADKSKIFVGGHSAGAYLSGMLACAPRYLSARNIKNTELAGAILLSGQASTHFRVRKDLGDKKSQYLPKIDEFSLLGNADNKCSPICLIVGDRRLEFPERVEENFLLAAVLKKLNSSRIVEIYELQGLTHGTVFRGLIPISTDFMKKVLDAKESNPNTK